MPVAYRDQHEGFAVCASCRIRSIRTQSIPQKLESTVCGKATSDPRLVLNYSVKVDELSTAFGARRRSFPPVMPLRTHELRIKPARSWFPSALTANSIKLSLYRGTSCKTCDWGQGTMMMAC